MSNATERHMDRVAQMACICCTLLGARQKWPTEVHHIRADREERNDLLTLPLCGDGCHRGPKGVHGDKTYLRMLKMTEWGLLGCVIERMYA